MRLRHFVQINPPKSEVAHWPGDTEVVFAPMEALADGLGGLDTSTIRPLEEVSGGSYSYFAEGDLLLAKVTPCFENGKKAIATGLPTSIGFATSEVHVIRVKSDRLDKRYLNYVFCSDHFQFVGVSNMTGAGGLRRVPETAILNYRLPVPDLPTQKRIADFVDRETARIDQLIEKKQRLVTLLEERQQVILETFIKGKTRPDHALRDSGVDWIGTIPAHWKAPKFTQVARLESGHTPSRKVEEYWIPGECTVPWFTLSDIWQVRRAGRVYVSETSEKVSPRGLANSAARLLPAGTVMLSRTASVGFPAIMAVPMATSQDFVNWVCGRELRSKFLYYVLRGMGREFSRLRMGSTHQTIYMPAVRSFRTPLPPLSEQDEIITGLDKQLESCGTLLSAVTSTIDRLQELRSALITAAVTDQIDVDIWRKRGNTDRRLEAIEEEVNA